MADSEKLYTFKKQLRKLASYRGSGTELISVYIPAGSPVHEMGNKLREEMSQASNIKSKSTKLNVLGALERIGNYLKMYKKTPDNGIAVFAGNISDNAAKVDIELFSIDPPEPLNIGAYRCDSKFFLDPLESMLETKDVYGIVVLDGREATLATVKGTNINIVRKLNSTAHAKIRKGGQCLAAGTLIIREDGELLDIEDFNIDSGIAGLDFQKSKTMSLFASDFFITPAKHSLIIRVECPLSEIRATPYHRFFVMSEYGVKEKFAKDLEKKDRLLIAKKINCEQRKIKTGYAPEKRLMPDKKEREKLRNARMALALSQKKAAEKVGLSQMVISDLETGGQTPSNENLRNIYRLYGVCLDEKRFSRNILDFPEYWNESLAKLFGIICGDGTLDGNRIIIYEGSRQLVEEYRSLVKRAIGVEARVRIVDKRGQKGSFAKKKYYEIRIYSKEFVEAVKQIAPEIISEKQRDVPKAIPACKDSIVAAFLSGLYDAEGYLHGERVEIAMVDKKLMKKVQLLLLRFGILSSFSEKRVDGRKQWYVSISDKNALKTFKENIGFKRKDKGKKLEDISKKETKQQYTDQIPIDGREVFRFAKELGLKTSDFHAASCFFRNKKPLGREAFVKNILPVFRKKRSARGKEIYEHLKSIYDSDFTIASVKEKILVQKKEKFYDITIPVHSNFIADGFIVHNSARRYERLIEEQIETYYKRVGEAMDKAFLDKAKGVMVGGPGPTKEFFMKMKPFNYQIKVLGTVDTGYTDEYGVREVLAKSERILAQQEAVKEKVLVDRFIKEAVSEGLAVYGEKEVREAILSRQADKVLLSEDLEYVSSYYKCSCGAEDRKIFKEKADDSIPCKACGGQMKLQKEEALLDELADLARENNIEVEIISTSSTEGAQFFTGFAGVGAFLRYKTR